MIASAIWVESATCTGTVYSPSTTITIGRSEELSAPRS
jgi:hypothetical protein